MAVVARILADVVEGVMPLTVTFSIAVETGTPKTYLWDFGDGSSSTDGEPVHVYNTFGYHTVILEITDYDLDVTTLRMPGYVRVGKVSFTADVVRGSPPLDVNFTNVSSSPTGYQFTGWEWDFGDGSIHALGETGATHTYTDYGNYNVILQADMFRI